MKLKKLFAGVVAAAMMLTMAVPAFAKGPIKEDGITSYTLNKSYQLIGEGEAPAADFDFTITNASVTGSEKYKGLTNFPTPSMTQSVHYDAKKATPTGTGTGATDIVVDFLKEGKLIYDSVGQYVYTIAETVPKTGLAGVDYDQKEVSMKVTVVNDDTTGGFKINTISFTKNDEKISGKVDGNKNEEAAFINTYTANKLEVTKTVTGPAGDKNYPFSFAVTFTGPDGKTWDESALTFAEDAKSAIYENNTWNFTLAHGESISFANLPKGVTYSVVEKYLNADNQITINDIKYTASYANGTGKMDAAAVTATVTNATEGFVDTGVILDNAPYMLMLAVVAGGAMTLVIKKRREEE